MLKGFNVKKNISVSYISILVSSIIGLYSIPIAINYFNTEVYAIWILTTSIIAYLSVSSFGIPTASSAIISKSLNFDYQKKVIIKSILALCLISCLLLTLFSVIYFTYPNWPSILGDFSEENSDLAAAVFAIMIVGFLLYSPLQIIITTFSSFQLTYLTKIYQLMIIVLNFIVLLYVVKNECSVIGLAFITIASNMFVHLIALCHLFLYFKNSSDEKERNSESDILKIKTVFRNGFPFFSIGLASTIVWGTDNLVISHFIGLDEVVVYSIAFKLFTTGFILFTVFSSVMFPMYGKFYSLSRWDKIQKLYNLNLSILPVVASFIWLGGVLFGSEIISLWLGDTKLFGGVLLFYFLGGYGVVLSVVNTYANLLSGLNFVNNTVKISWLEALLNIFLSILFAKMIGIAGVAFGTLLASILAPFIFLPKYIKLNTSNKLTHSSSLFTLLFLIFSTVSIVSYISYKMDLSFILKVVVFLIYFIVFCFYIYKTNFLAIKSLKETNAVV